MINKNMYDSIMSDMIAFSLQNRTEFKHYGVGHNGNPPGRGSGAHPYGSGERPFQHDPKARAQYLKAKKTSSGSSGYTPESKRNIHDRTDEQVWREVNQRAMAMRTVSNVHNAVKHKNPTMLIFDTVNGARDLTLLAREKNRRSKLPVDEKTGFHLKNKEYSIKDDMNNSNFPAATPYVGTDLNGALCSMTYDMRRRGYDVYARELYAPLTKKQFLNFYPDGKFNKLAGKIDVSNHITSKESRAEIAKGIDSYPANSRGFIRTTGTLGGVHDMVFERTDGKTIVGNPQNGKTYDMSNPKDVNKAFRFTRAAVAMRTDNIKPNMERMKEVCQ